MKIIADSSLTITESMREGVDLKIIPFSINFDSETWVDTEDVDIKAFTESMKKSKKFQSSCPSPNDYLNEYMCEGDVFVITITSKLSGSYNSAMVAKKMYEEEYGSDKKIHVFDSRSAGPSPTLIFLMLKDLILKGLDFEDIRSKVAKYIASQNTLFVSLSLENLRKAGRLSNIKAKVAQALKITPLMGEENAEIVMLKKARGKTKAFEKLVDTIGTLTKNLNSRDVAIYHAGNLERAKSLKARIIEKYAPRAVHIVDGSCICTLYVNDRGIIVSF